MTELDIACERDPGGDWTCRVVISENDRPITEHRVRVGATDLERLDPGASDPHVLVDRSFGFLLARESASSILGSFDLMEIARYFPDYETTIRGASRD
jgi:hypothetical protein